MFGISDFQAILNPPQAAILAISRIQEVPIIKNHVVVPGKTLESHTLCRPSGDRWGGTCQFLQTLKKIF